MWSWESQLLRSLDIALSSCPCISIYTMVVTPSTIRHVLGWRQQNISMHLPLCRPAGKLEIQFNSSKAFNEAARQVSFGVHIWEFLTLHTPFLWQSRLTIEKGTMLLIWHFCCVLLQQSPIRNRACWIEGREVKRLIDDKKYGNPQEDK